MANPSDAQSNKLSGWSERLLLVEQDIGLLVLSREIYAALVSSVPIPNPNTQPENFYFYWWCCGNYGAAAAMGIRRHATGGPGSSGLVKLLAEFKEEPELLSREFFMQSSGAQPALDASARWFDDHFGAGAAYVSAEIVGQDIVRLHRAAKRIPEFATNWLAHFLPTKKGAKGQDITPDEVHQCLEVVEEVLERYATFFKAHRNPELWPVPRFQPVKILRARPITAETLKAMWSAVPPAAPVPPEPPR